MANISDSLFINNQEAFNRHFLSICELKGIEPKTFFQFPIILPYHLTFMENSMSSLLCDENSIAAFHFSSVTETKSLYAGLVDGKTLSLSVKRTRVEMLYITQSTYTKDALYIENINYYFNRLLQQLNYLIVSNLIITKDIDVYRISREMLEFSTFYRVITLINWEILSEFLFPLNFNVPIDKTQLTSEDQSKVNWFARVLEQNWNPFLLSEELMLNAKKQFKEGFYREAIMTAQASVENYLRTLYLHFLKFDGKTEDESNEILDTTAFITMVKKQFHTRIGGKWDIASAGPVGDWYKKTYELRNRVAHGGLQPSYEETDEAIKYAIKLRHFVAVLIKKNLKKYPNLAPFFLPYPMK